MVASHFLISSRCLFFHQGLTVILGGKVVKPLLGTKRFVDLGAIPNPFSTQSRAVFEPLFEPFSTQSSHFRHFFAQFRQVCAHLLSDFGSFMSGFGSRCGAIWQVTGLASCTTCSNHAVSMQKISFKSPFINRKSPSFTKYAGVISTTGILNERWLVCVLCFVFPARTPAVMFGRYIHH